MTAYSEKSILATSGTNHKRKANKFMESLLASKNSDEFLGRMKLNVNLIYLSLRVFKLSIREHFVSHAWIAFIPKVCDLFADKGDDKAFLA